MKGSILWQALSIVFMLLLVSGCQTVLMEKMEKTDPLKGFVSLDGKGGWNARLLWASDCGVWTVELCDALRYCAGPEVVALDDKGRCALLSLNADVVWFWQPVMDGWWLGGVCHGDMDPQWEGPELYVGGKRGNLYQVVQQPQGGFNAKVVAYFPGKEIHTLVAWDGKVYAGLNTGELVRVEPTSSMLWNTRIAHKDPGRIRDAVILKDGSLVYVSRSGRVARLYPRGEGMEEELLYTCPQGLARIDLGSASSGDELLYVVGDDGQVMRFSKEGEGRWNRELIYSGPLGARGIAAGRFDADPDKETIALFGYSGRVEILRRDAQGRWYSETIFEDLDKGHWLSAGELDDKNGTDEIVVSGYGARVVLLARPEGYGL